MIDGQVGVRVHPAMVPATHPLASVRDSFNAVFIEGEAVGELMLYGRGAGALPTSSALHGDLIDAAHNLSIGGTGRAPVLAPAKLRPVDDLRSQYYLALDVADQPGVLAAVAGILGDHGVSIQSMEQQGLGDEARLVFITHVAREADVQATLVDLKALDSVRSVGGLLRVIGDER
jgi:homoserine dehydrogenase